MFVGDLGGVETVGQVLLLLFEDHRVPEENHVRLPLSLHVLVDVLPEEVVLRRRVLQVQGLVQHVELLDVALQLGTEETGRRVVLVLQRAEHYIMIIARE